MVTLLQNFPSLDNVNNYSDNIVVHDINMCALSKADAERFFCVVTPCASSNLSDEIKRGLNIESARNIFAQIVRDVVHVHSHNILHRNIKPLNIVQVNGRWKLTDFGFACTIGESVLCTERSAYSPPEALEMELNTSLVQPTQTSFTAEKSFDIWSLGAVLYELVAKDASPLFREDLNRTGEDNLRMRYEWTNIAKDSKLLKVEDGTARDLLRLMLVRNSSSRLDLEHVLQHHFMTGRQPTRFLGNEPSYDIFLSYRCAADTTHSDKLYQLLTKTWDLKVWRDREVIKPGVLWKNEIYDGLSNSRIFVCLLSKEAISNFGSLDYDSVVDNLYLEHRLALEMRKSGHVECILPVFIGEKDTTTHNYKKFSIKNDVPTVKDVAVTEVENEIIGFLGARNFPNQTVKSVIDSIMDFQGVRIDATDEAGYAKIVNAIVKAFYELKLQAKENQIRTLEDKLTQKQKIIEELRNA